MPRRGRGNLMFSQRNNPYCELLSKLCGKSINIFFDNQIFFHIFEKKIINNHEKNIRT